MILCYSSFCLFIPQSLYYFTYIMSENSPPNHPLYKSFPIVPVIVMTVWALSDIEPTTPTISKIDRKQANSFAVFSNTLSC